MNGCPDKDCGFCNRVWPERIVVTDLADALTVIAMRDRQIRGREEQIRAQAHSIGLLQSELLASRRLSFAFGVLTGLALALIVVLL